MNGLFDFLSRPFFSILGAFGLFSLVSTFTSVDEGIEQWLLAWRAVTYPLWEFILEGPLGIFDLTLPNWMKDYLSLGVIACCTKERAVAKIKKNDGIIVNKFWYRYSDEARNRVREIHAKKTLPQKIWRWATGLFFWPLVLISDVLIDQFLIKPRFLKVKPIDTVAKEARDLNMASRRDYWSTYFMTLLIFATLIALNYALFFDWIV